MKRYFCVLIFYILISGLSTAAAQIGNTGIQSSDSIYVAVLDPLALENACACVGGYAQRDYHALADYMSLALHRQVKVEFSTGIDNVIRRIGRRPDIVIGKTTIVKHQAREMDMSLVHIAMLTDKTGSVLFHGLFAVRSQDKCKTISDLKARNILFGPKEAQEKHDAALDELKHAGIVLKEPVLFRNSCSETALDVVNKQADAAVISSYALPLLEGCQTIDKGALKVIGRTRGVPFVGVFVTDRIFPVMLNDVKQAFLDMAADKSLLVKLESKSGFVEIDSIAKELQKKKKSAEPKRSDQPVSWTGWRGSPKRSSFSPFVPGRLPDKPKFIWRKKTNAQGVGGIAATDKYVIFSDKSKDETMDVWHCLSADNGKELWNVTYPAGKSLDYTSSARATPLIIDDKVYLLGALGDLYCAALDSGKIIWEFNILKKWGGKLGAWGFCGTPLAVDGKLILQTPSSDTALIAVNRNTGKQVWRGAGNGMSHGNLIVAEFNGCRQIIGYDSKSAGAWDIKTGKRLWTLVPPNDNDFNVPTPLQVGSFLLLTTENNSTRMYAFDKTGRIITEPTAVFDDLNPDICSPTLAGNVVWASCYTGMYCLDTDNNLRNIWHSDTDNFSDYTCIIAGKRHVLISIKSGKLALLPARPLASDKPQILTVFKTDGDFEPEMWSFPALMKNRIYLRTDSEIAALHLPD